MYVIYKKLTPIGDYEPIAYRSDRAEYPFLVSTTFFLARAKVYNSFTFALLVYFFTDWHILPL